MWGAGGGWQQASGGAEVANLVGVQLNAAIVAGEEHQQALLPVLGSDGPRHLALLVVHELVAVVPGKARPREEHLLA